MRVLVLFHIAPDADRAAVVAHLDEEVAALWDLYSGGVVTEVYLTDDPATVVAIAQGDSTEDVRHALARLPLVAAGHLTASLHALLPFVNWRRLFADPATSP